MKRKKTMSKKILAVAAGALMALTFTACGEQEEGSTDHSLDEGEYSPSDPGGMGMTYNGKMGVDMGGGFVIPFDGSSPGLGFGM